VKRGVRILIYFFPLLVVLAAAYFLSSLQQHGRAQEDSLTFAIDTVPIGVHPFTEQDPVSEEIESLLFDSLLGRNGQMELEPRLAESWSFASTARFFYTAPVFAERAWDKLSKETGAQWRDWGITDAALLVDELRFQLDDAHTDTPKKILAALPPENLAPVQVWEIRTRSSAAESFSQFMSGAVEKGQVRGQWADGPGYLEVRSAGKSENFARELKIYYDSNQPLQINADTPLFRQIGELPYLVEPSLTMNLRTGVTFQDGKPLTVKDVLYSLNLARDPDSDTLPLVNSALRNVQSIEPKGPFSFRVTYRGEMATALEMWEQLPILPSHGWHSYDPGHPEIPLTGSGPFAIARWVPGEPIILERNPTYYRGQPQNARIVYERVLDDRLLRMQFETFAIDSYAAAPDTFQDLQHNPAFNLAMGPALQHSYVAWNFDKPVFQDARVRRALALAVDSGSLIDRLLFGNGAAVESLFHPATPMARAKFPTLPPDPSAAGRLLNEAGWSELKFGQRHQGRDPLRFRLALLGSDEPLGRELQRQWRKLGIQTQLHFVTYGRMAGIKAGKVDFDAVLVTEPLSHYLDLHGRWHSSEIAPGRGNYTRYRDARTDEILEQIRREGNPRTAPALAKLLQDRFGETQPLCPLYLSRSARVFHKDRALVLDMTGKGESPETRAIGANAVSLTYDLAWWVKQTDAAPPEPATAPLSVR